LSPEIQIREKRRESRRVAQGVVQLRFFNPGPVRIKGRLIDISSSGFRMAHTDPSLATGIIVDFSHASGSGRARAMWNRIADGRVETGFLIVG